MAETLALQTGRIENVDCVMKIPAELREQLVKGLVVPFVGSGVSSAVQANGTPLFPSWSELLLGLADELDEQCSPKEASDVRAHCNNKNWYEAADAALEGLHKYRFNKYMRLRFQIQERADADLSLPLAIWQLQPAIVLTTNYDDVLRWSKPGSRQILNDHKAELVELQRSANPQQPSVWHLHGHISDVDSLILSPAQYDAFYREAGDALYGAARFQLKSLLVNQTMLFVGFGMQDEYIMRIVGEVLSIFDHNTPRTSPC